MKIGRVQLKNNLILAPMAGDTDIGFRRQCALLGAGLTVTEMVSAAALHFGDSKTEKMLVTDESEVVKAVQIFGSSPEYMAEACANPLLDKFDIIDINMGCPVPKVTKTGAGSALMNTPELAADIVRACVEATPRPVTCKFRLGYDSVNYLEFGRMMEQAGASAVALHARTRTQGYAGEADHYATRRLVDALKIPVIANGDIKDLESYRRISGITNAQGYMIGQGARGNPWIFADILAGAEVGRDRLRVITDQINTMLRYYDDRYVAVNMRSAASHYLKGIEGSKPVKERIHQAQSTVEIIEALKTIF